MRHGRMAWIIPALFLTAWMLDLERDIGGRDCFSWMDPAQYYSFAGAVVEGRGPGGGFEVASAYPWIVAPFLAAGRSVTAALRVNLFSALLLALSVVLIHRSLRLAAPPAFPLFLALTAPLLLGLSRELYVEFTLSAFVAFQYVLWFRTDRFRRNGATLLFALFFAAGLALKMTFLLFFAGPLIAEAADAVGRREGGRLARLAAAVLVPAVVVLGGVRIFLPDSFSYYASFGNTRIPIMRFIGPPDLFTWESAVYYAAQLGRTVLGPVAIFLLVPLVLWKRLGGNKTGEGRDRFGVLWLWFLVPLLVLTFQAVKEPRHIAPIVLPALLLVVAGVERIRAVAIRTSLVVALIVLTLAQYLAVTRADCFCPYRLTAPLEPRAVEREMVKADPERRRHTGGDGRIDINRWRFTRSIALSGFDRNESLALAWYFAPGVVFDLDIPQWNTGRDRPYERFEDLFYFSALNIYNARCGWPGYLRSLSREEVIAHADYLLLADESGEDRTAWPGFEEIARFDRGKGVALLARSVRPDQSFREVYAAEFLRRQAPEEERELNTIYFSLFMSERLRGRIPDRERLLEGFPDRFVPGSDRRNIYWIAHDFPLTALAERAYRDHLAGRL